LNFSKILNRILLLFFIGLLPLNATAGSTGGDSSESDDDDDGEPESKRRRTDDYDPFPPTTDGMDVQLLPAELELVEIVDMVPAEIWVQILMLVGPVERNRMRLMSNFIRDVVDTIRRNGLTDTLPVVRILEGFDGHFAPRFINGRMFVLNRDQPRLTVLDATTWQLVGNIPVHEFPDIPVEAGRFLLIPYALDTAVTVVDVDTLDVAREQDFGAAPITLPNGGPALVVTDYRSWEGIATIPMFRRPPARAMVGRYQADLVTHGVARTTITFTNPQTGRVLHTFTLAFGALMPILFRHYLFFAEPNVGTIQVVDFSGHL